jgi:hypothetical protein
MTSLQDALEPLTPAEMAEADRLAGDGPALMEATGRPVTRAALGLFFPCRTVALARPRIAWADGFSPRISAMP